MVQPQWPAWRSLTGQPLKLVLASFPIALLLAYHCCLQEGQTQVHAIIPHLQATKIPESFFRPHCFIFSLLRPDSVVDISLSFLVTFLIFLVSPSLSRPEGLQQDPQAMEANAPSLMSSGNFIAVSQVSSLRKMLNFQILLEWVEPSAECQSFGF